MPLGQRPLLPPRPRLLRPVTTAAFVATTLQALATPSRLLILTTPRQRPYPVADCAADFVSRVTARNRLPLDYSERSLRIVDFLIDGLRKGGAYREEAHDALLEPPRQSCQPLRGGRSRRGPAALLLEAARAGPASHRLMTGSETVEVAYGEGWDSGRAAVLGPIDAAVAAARDAGGLPYAVMLRQQGSPGVVVAHVAWERHYLGSRSSTTRPPIGRDADGEVACFVADMLILHEATLTRPARSAGR